MNWLTLIKGTIPTYAVDMADNLEYVMVTLPNMHEISEVDAHGCALAAAIASNNAGFADEISMNGPLFRTQEREAAKIAALLVAQDDLYSNFRTLADAALVGLAPSNFSHTGSDTFGGVTPLKYNMYALAAAVALKSNINITNYSTYMRGCYATDQQIQAVGQIASVIASFTKIVI